jgi:hypothetical protein
MRDLSILQIIDLLSLFLNKYLKISVAIYNRNIGLSFSNLGFKLIVYNFNVKDLKVY